MYWYVRVISTIATHNYLISNTNTTNLISFVECMVEFSTMIDDVMNGWTTNRDAVATGKTVCVTYEERKRVGFPFTKKVEVLIFPGKIFSSNVLLKCAPVSSINEKVRVQFWTEMLSTLTTDISTMKSERNWQPTRRFFLALLDLLQQRSSPVADSTFAITTAVHWNVNVDNALLFGLITFSSAENCGKCLPQRFRSEDFFPALARKARKH
jgi:hypothetical protein